MGERRLLNQNCACAIAGNRKGVPPLSVSSMVGAELINEKVVNENFE
jgi:hypothetical protein